MGKTGKPLPTEVDWRQQGLVADVKDQGSCCSCWTFSTVASIEGAHAKKYGRMVTLSEQNLVDCVKKDRLPSDEEDCCDGCDGGLMDNAFDYIINKQKGGIDTVFLKHVENLPMKNFRLHEQKFQPALCHEVLGLESSGFMTSKEQAQNMPN